LLLRQYSHFRQELIGKPIAHKGRHYAIRTGADRVVPSLVGDWLSSREACA